MLARNALAALGALLSAAAPAWAQTAAGNEFGIRQVGADFRQGVAQRGTGNVASVRALGNVAVTIEQTGANNTALLSHRQGAQAAAALVRQEGDGKYAAADLHAAGSATGGSSVSIVQRGQGAHVARVDSGIRQAVGAAAANGLGAARIHLLSEADVATVYGTGSLTGANGTVPGAAENDIRGPVAVDIVQEGAQASEADIRLKGGAARVVSHADLRVRQEGDGGHLAIAWGLPQFTYSHGAVVQTGAANRIVVNAEGAVAGAQWEIRGVRQEGANNVLNLQHVGNGTVDLDVLQTGGAVMALRVDQRDGGGHVVRFLGAPQFVNGEVASADPARASDPRFNVPDGASTVLQEGSNQTFVVDAEQATAGAVLRTDLVRQRGSGNDLQATIKGGGAVVLDSDVQGSGNSHGAITENGGMARFMARVSAASSGNVVDQKVRGVGPTANVMEALVDGTGNSLTQIQHGNRGHQSRIDVVGNENTIKIEQGASLNAGPSSATLLVRGSGNSVTYKVENSQAARFTPTLPTITGNNQSLGIVVKAN